jgi:hypothetical protein
MKAISRRHKLIGGVFAIVSVAWALDMLTGEAGPSPAGGATATAMLGQPAELPPNPPDLETLVQSLLRKPQPRTALPFESVRRDLFVPSGPFEAAHLSILANKSAQPLPQEQNASEKTQPFEAQHELQGILTGPVPLALIDGRLVREGALVDGYRLVRIDVDHVVLQQNNNQVTLRVRVTGDR